MIRTNGYVQAIEEYRKRYSWRWGEKAFPFSCLRWQIFRWGLRCVGRNGA